MLARVEGGDFSGAEAEVRSLLRSDPASAKAQFLLGYVLFHERRYVESLAAYTAGAHFGAPESADLLTVASDYIQLRSYPDAVHWLTFVTEHDPQNVQAWYLLGRTEYLLDHPDEALHAFERCLQLKPRDLRAKYNAGLALERLQRASDAKTAYQEAIAWATEDGSADPQPWLDLGNLLLAEQKPAEAATVLARAAALAPRNALCQQQLGVALDAAGRHAEAVVALQRATLLAPTADRAHYLLARALRQAGQKEQADAEFAIVDRLHSSHAGQETPNPDVLSSPTKGGEKTQ